MGEASKPRSRVSIGSTGRVIEFGSSEDTRAILSDNTCDVYRYQKPLAERMNRRDARGVIPIARHPL